MRYFAAVTVLLSLIGFAAEVSKGVPADDSGIPVGRAFDNAVKRSRLAEAGSAPFHLLASVSPTNSFIPDYRAEIEEYWVSPEKWRRTIRSGNFEQTVIVSGTSRYEKNSSDYFPKWLNDIVIALVDVVPAETIDEVSKLSDEVPPPDGNRGDWAVTFHPESTDGSVHVTWTGSVKIGRQTGTLSWINGKDFAAGYDDYRLFHGRTVAYRIETFPPIPHGDVKTQITELSDLVQPDDSLFTIPQATPADQQLRIVRVPEVEYRKLAVGTPVMKWSPVKVRPTSGSFATRIVTDRTGRIRECEFVISNNMTMAADATELVRQWRFQPLLVDGVPVEVETTMTFNFDTTIAGDQAQFQPASYYFKRGRDLTYPRTDGSAPFHMKGTFVGTGIFTGFHGDYEETWIAPNRWRRQMTVAESTVIETRIGEDHYITSISPGISRIVDRVFSLFGGEFPGYAYFSPDTDWHMADITFEDIPVTRVAMGRVDDGKVSWSRGYYFDQEGKVRARTNLPETITYEEFVEFSGKQVPRLIKSNLNDLLALTAHIDLLEPTGQKPDDFFDLKGVQPKDWVRPSPW